MPSNMSPTLHLALLLLGTTILSLTKAQADDPYASIDSLCSPTSPSGIPDLNFPCNAVQAIQAQCIYGPQGLSMITTSDSPSNSTTTSSSSQSSAQDILPQTQPNATQQICFCNSQFWSLTSACAACYSFHGDHEVEKSAGKDAVQSLSRKYCDASATPSLGLADFLYQFAGGVEMDSGDDSSSSSSTTTKMKDSIKGKDKTDVKFYYTPSVTGSRAWVVADPTATSGFVKDGQLVATASVNVKGAEKGDAAGGRKMGLVAGVLGIMGLVALSLM